MRKQCNKSKSYGERQDDGKSVAVGGHGENGCHGNQVENRRPAGYFGKANEKMVKLANKLLREEKQARPNQTQSGVCLPGARVDPPS
jgi:hypothetical protein